MAIDSKTGLHRRAATSARWHPGIFDERFSPRSALSSAIDSLITSGQVIAPALVNLRATARVSRLGPPAASGSSD